MIALGRILTGFGLSLATAIALPWILPVVVFGRGSYSGEIASALSCLLNALTGGPRTVTFSAWAWELQLRGKRGAALRVRLTDAINLHPGHCRDAWRSHADRGLLP